MKGQFKKKCYCARLAAELHPTLLRLQGLEPARLLCPWEFPGKNTGGGGAISFSRRSSWPRDLTCISCIDRQILYQWVTWKVKKKILKEKCLIPWRFYSWRFYRIVFVQWLSCVWLFATPWTVAHQAPLSSTVSRSLPKFMTIELVMPSNHFILCSPLLRLLSVFPSIRVFYNRVPNFKFSFEISHQDVK